jgi:hypothetical protein
MAARMVNARRAPRGVLSLAPLDKLPIPKACRFISPELGCLYMEKERLLQTLNELRAEVAQADSVDPQTMASLEAAIRDLQRELDKRGGKQPANIEPASTGLRDTLLRFEADHPQFSTAVGRVADALAAIGI